MRRPRRATAWRLSIAGSATSTSSGGVSVVARHVNVSSPPESHGCAGRAPAAATPTGMQLIAARRSKRVDASRAYRPLPSDRSCASWRSRVTSRTVRQPLPHHSTASRTDMPSSSVIVFSACPARLSASRTVPSRSPSAGGARLQHLSSQARNPVLTQHCARFLQDWPGASEGYGVGGRQKASTLCSVVGTAPCDHHSGGPKGRNLDPRFPVKAACRRAT